MPLNCHRNETGVVYHEPMGRHCAPLQSGIGSHPGGAGANQPESDHHNASSEPLHAASSLRSRRNSVKLATATTAIAAALNSNSTPS